MGFEAFTLLVESTANPNQILQILIGYGFKPKQNTARTVGENKYEFVNDAFILEAAIDPSSTGAARLVIEQALCNPTSAEKCITSVLFDVLSLGAYRGWFLTSSTPNLSFDSEKHSAATVIDLVLKESRALRAKWQAAFGNKTGPVRIADAYSFVGVIS